VYCKQVGFILGINSSTHKSIKEIQYINTMKSKIHVIILINAEKEFDKIQHHFVIKKFSTN